MVHVAALSRRLAVRTAKNLGENLHAFEFLPGPYSVAHLRLTQRLAAALPSEDWDAGGVTAPGATVLPGSGSGGQP